MAHLMPTSDEDDYSLLTTSYSTMDSSSEDIKPDMSMVCEAMVPGHPLSAGQAPEETGDSCEEVVGSPDPGVVEKKAGGKKSSKKGGMKGLKGAAGDDSFTISTLSAGRGQKKLQGHLTSSLLEEVLSEKKMALLRSPDVMEQLQFLQEDIRLSRQEPLLHTDTASASASTVPSKSSRGQQQSTTKGVVARHVEPPSDQQQQASACDVIGGMAGSSTSIVWSKEGSAFTSVASTAGSASHQST